MPEYAIQLAADLYAGEPVDRWEGNKWTERGHEIEDAARAYYENSFPDRLVTRVGFVTNDDGTAGASPDSLVDADGLLEIKCLSAVRHIKVMAYVEKHHHAPSDYIAQPQGQIYICEREWCDLLFYHPELPAIVLTQRPDGKIVLNLQLQIGSCITERDKIIDMLNRY